MSQLDVVPLFEKLENCGNILVAGAGGGYDLFSGLPLYFRLKERGHEVWLANYSFTDLDVTASSPLEEITSDSPEKAYFPEKYLCDWLDSNYENGAVVYGFGRTGVQPMREAYQGLVDELELDAVVLVDGGTDSLMRGDEEELGTPTEDMTSVAAVAGLDVPVKLLSSIGFGVDTFHGVCHHYFLEAVADLTRSGHFLGAFSLLPDSEEARLYAEALDYVHEQMSHHPSIVNSSIVSALRGEFGNFHATTRTQGSQLYINPLMTLYWNFELDGVAQRCLYLDQIEATRTMTEVGHAILRFQEARKLRGWESLPM